MKRIILIIMALIIITSTIGCTASDLENYKTAMDKTDNMIRGTVLTEISTTLDFNTQGLKNEILEYIEKFKESKITIKNSFDKELKKGKDEGYVVIGDLGYDFNIYNIDDKFYIEPLFINLRDKRFIEFTQKNINTDTEISEDLFKAFSVKWSEILKEENVVKGEKVLITTDDGEVKSREFTISLNDTQLKELLLYMIEYLEIKDDYKELLGEMSYFSDDIEMTEAEKEKTYIEALKEMKKFIDGAEGLNLFYKAYIDIDNYIVKEDIKFKFANETNDSGELKSLEFDMVNQYLNIEKEQSLNFEAPNPKDVLNLDDVDWEEFKW